MVFNCSILKKQNIHKFLKEQFLTTWILIIVGVYLTRNTISPIYSSISIICLFFYSYFAHRIIHLLPENINPHLIHHNNKQMSRVMNLTIEMLTNTLMFFILYIFQKIINITILPNMLILYYGIIYTSIHIINYSIFGNNHHKKHHESVNKTQHYNYGPDTIDHIFETNFDDSWENFVHMLPNILISYIICSYIPN